MPIEETPSCLGNDVLLLATLLTASAADWTLADQVVVWPLCGRIAEDPPPGWTPERGCPDAHTGVIHHDLPIDSTYGPRIGSDDGPRFDWHRGIDLHTPCGTPIFAIASGTVTVAGSHSAYADNLIRIRHARAASCEGGCFHSEYVHISGVNVRVGAEVKAGQLIGWTGYTGVGRTDFERSASVCARPHEGREHLHLELREAAIHTPFSTWNHDAISPLAILPSAAAPIERYAVSIVDVDTSTPGEPDVTVQIVAPTDQPLDLDAIGVRIWDRSSGTPVPVAQPSSSDGTYTLNPNWISFDAWNRMWTHKVPAYAPWESWTDCPFHDQHGKRYHPNVHVEQPGDANHMTSWFNGITLAPTARVVDADHWTLQISFHELIGPISPANLCIAAYVRDVHQQVSAPTRWGCR